MKASVIGATGFAGAELLRLLDGHPEVELAAITSESSTGENITAMYPHLASRIETTLSSMKDIEQIADNSDVIFIALPHGHAMKIGRQLKTRNVKIVDLGGDYRFKDPKVFEAWYKVEHEDPETKAVYGHTPEIEQVYSDYAGKDVIIQFTPHLLPVDRGILSTCYADLCEGVTAAQVSKAFADMYANEYFIRLRGQGVFPEIKNVRASNYVDIGWQLDQRTGRVIVMSALDNLVKGAAGQAVQNMNVMFGMQENTGLTQLPIYP